MDDFTILAAVVYVATTGCAWRQVPPVFGASCQTVHRRFPEWSAARVWAKLYRILLDELGARGEPDWSRCATSLALEPLVGSIPPIRSRRG